MFNYNAALLSEGLFFLNFLDSVSEGDGGRIIRQYKYLMLLCRADEPHSTKYALESLYQLFLANSLSEKEAEIFVWNRTLNNHSGLGNNIPHDLEVEHSNHFNKQGFGNLGVNLTEKAVKKNLPSRETSESCYWQGRWPFTSVYPFRKTCPTFSTGGLRCAGQKANREQCIHISRRSKIPTFQRISKRCTGEIEHVQVLHLDK